RGDRGDLRAAWREKHDAVLLHRELRRGLLLLITACNQRADREQQDEISHLASRACTDAWAARHAASALAWSLRAASASRRTARSVRRASSTSSTEMAPRLKANSVACALWFAAPRSDASKRSRRSAAALRSPAARRSSFIATARARARASIAA